MSRLLRLALPATRIAAAPATPALALLSGLIFLFKPAQLFEANAPFFYFGFAQIALLLVPAFMVAFATLAWLASRLGPQSQRALAALLGGIALAAWINATFVASVGGPLDGRALLVQPDQARVVLNAILFASAAMAGAAIVWWRPLLGRRFLAAVFIVLAAQTLWIAATDEHPWRPRSSMQELAKLSPKKNVLVILLDAFQADFFAEIVVREPALASVFQGFTYFPNAVGPAPTTYLALPVIHAGIPYQPGESLRETYRRHVVQDSFMAKLGGSGYDAMLVNPILNHCPAGVICDHEGSLVRGRLKALAEAGSFLVDLAVYRIVPDALRPAVYAEGSWMSTRWFSEERVVTSNAVLEQMARSLHVESPRPVARFLHLFGTHAPARLDGRCQPAGNAPWTRKTAVAQDRCALLKLSAVLRSLQVLGVYDRTAIAVLADHGAGLPHEEQGGWVWGAAASPLLLVKPFGAHGPLTTSTRVVGLGDVAASVCSWTADCRMESGSDLFDEAKQPSNYLFLAYFWRHEYWLADAIPVLARYEVSGPPRDVASWKRLP